MVSSPLFIELRQHMTNKTASVPAQADDEPKLHRSTFAIKKGLELGLPIAVKASGANSVSDMLSLIAQDPLAAGEALKPVFAKLMSARLTSDASRKASIKELVAAQDLTPEELAQVAAEVRARRVTAAG